MNTVSKKQRIVKPALCNCELLAAPVAPCEILANGFPGTMTINGTEYAVRILGYLPPAPAEPVIDGYRLTKANGESHDICLVAGRFECTCGDYEFRRASQQNPETCECKHIKAIRQLCLPPVDQYQPRVEEDYEAGAYLTDEERGEILQNDPACPFCLRVECEC